MEGCGVSQKLMQGLKTSKQRKKKNGFKNSIEFPSEGAGLCLL